VDDVSRMVARQYEAYAYPAPTTDLDARLAEGYHEFGNPRDYAALLWPQGRPRRPLALLAAGCGTVQAAYLAHTHRDSLVVGVDLSEASLAHERFLQERHGLTNLRLFRGDLRELPTLLDKLGDAPALGASGGGFDAIVCSGVLHHLADPDEGLRALAGVLAPGGALSLMLYGATARAGVYMVQDALRRLRVPQTADGVAFARRLVEQLPARHAVRSYVDAAAELKHDSAFVDTFLHPQDRAYTVPQVLEFLDRNGLAFSGWVDNALYFADAALARFSPEVRGAVAALPPAEQWAVVEMLTQNLGMHMFVARAATAVAMPGAVPDAAGGQPPGLQADDWQQWVPHRAPGLRRAPPAAMGLNLATPGSVRWQRGALAFELGPGQAALLEGADGSRRIGELLALPALVQLPPASAALLIRDFLAQMWRLGHLMFSREPA